VPGRMLAVVALEGWDDEVVDWAKVCADKARIDAIKKRKRAETNADDAIIEVRDGGGVDNECGEGFNECAGEVKLLMGEDGWSLGLGLLRRSFFQLGPKMEGRFVAFFH
jgi:hypothetical protein